MTVAEVIAISVSVLSLIISSLLAILQIVNERKSNRHNLKANLIKDMYEKTLTIKIPKGREYIHFDGKNISGVNQLMDAISQIRRSSLLFKAVDKHFYDKILNECQRAEDYLNNTFREYSSTEFSAFMNQVDEYVNNIYSLISIQYSEK